MNWSRAETIVLCGGVGLWGLNAGMRALIEWDRESLGSLAFAVFMAISCGVVAYCACASIARDRWNR